MGPLNGVRVVELAGLAPSPFGCMILADLGANVLRVRRGGNLGDALVPPHGPLDRGKHGIRLDLKDDSDRTALREIARVADVLVEGFRPGVAERLGIGPGPLRALNHRLIYARMTGWGQDGPLAGRAGHDINYIALAGILDPIGRAGSGPIPPLNIVGDFAGGGLLLAMGVVTALYERERSGAGQVVDAAMLDGAALLSSFLHGLLNAQLWTGERGTNLFDGGAPFYDTYACADDLYLAVGCVEPHFYARLLDGLGLADEDLPFQLDRAQWPTLKKIIAERFAGRTRDEWLAIFEETDACVTPVLTPMEAPDHPHNRERGVFVEVGGIRQPAPAPRFSRTGTRVPTKDTDEPDAVRALLASWGVADELAHRVSGRPGEVNR